MGQEIEVETSEVEVDKKEVIEKPLKVTTEMMKTDGTPATTEKEDQMEMIQTNEKEEMVKTMGAIDQDQEDLALQTGRNNN